jgi:hypothetical protein
VFQCQKLALREASHRLYHRGQAQGSQFSSPMPLENSTCPYSSPDTANVPVGPPQSAPFLSCASSVSQAVMPLFGRIGCHPSQPLASASPMCARPRMHRCLHLSGQLHASTPSKHRQTFQTRRRGNGTIGCLRNKHTIECNAALHSCSLPVPPNAPIMHAFPKPMTPICPGVRPCHWSA